MQEGDGAAAVRAVLTDAGYNQPLVDYERMAHRVAVFGERDCAAVEIEEAAHYVALAVGLAVVFELLAVRFFRSAAVSPAVLVRAEVELAGGRGPSGADDACGRGRVGCA